MTIVLSAIPECTGGTMVLKVSRLVNLPEKDGSEEGLKVTVIIFLNH